MTSPSIYAPLEGTRVLDLSDGLAALTGLFLAELGAEVILVEPPEGSIGRSAAPVLDGISHPFMVANAGKASVTINWESPTERAAFEGLAKSAQIIILGPHSQRHVEPASLLELKGSLVVISISPFGQWGPYRDLTASEAVFMGLNGMIARSGRAGFDPLIPPRGLVENSAALQAAWAALVALHKATRTGEGEYIDLSVFEASAQIFDPPFGAVGSARAMIEPEQGAMDRGRPDMGYLYPTIPCKDGHVRIAILARRQWQGLWRCIGSPEEFADERYFDIQTRFAAWPAISRLVTEFFTARTVDELLQLGLEYSFPIGEVFTPAQALSTDHVRDRQIFLDCPMPDGSVAKLASGFVEINEQRWHRNPALVAPGADNERYLIDDESATVHEVSGNPTRAARLAAGDGAPSGPLAGIRILDLGVIVVGAETGRLYADLGADVIKVESLDFPDGMRMGSTGPTVTAAFAWGHRNKRSLGLNLRAEEGRSVFLDLVREADAVVSNFKPGTLDKLGIGYDTLAAVNPRIIVGESSAYGATGPWSGRMGFGPLVRASVGLAELWRYPEMTDGFGDDVTVFPDHANGRIMATTVLASINRARRTGVGCHIRSAQAETVLNVMAETYFHESLAPGSAQPIGNQGLIAGLPALLPCAGEDEWAVVEVSSSDQLDALARLARDPIRGQEAEAGDPIDTIIRWVAARTPYEVMWACQSLGIPAAPMLRPAEMPDDPHLRTREHFTTMSQSGLPLLPSEQGPAKFSTIAEPTLGPAPQFGEHTREVLTEWLNLPESEIQRLIASGVLEVR